jgi:hypothetical protein
MATRRMKAPSTIGAGSKVLLPDGSSTSVDAGGNVSIDDKFVDSMLEAGFTLFPLSGAVQHLRTRATIAQVNAGLELLPALPGLKYRLVDAALIAVGGAVAAADSVDILGTQSTAKKLMAGLVAGLTENTLLRAGAATNGVILAAGASFVANDANTAITLGKTGATATTATHVDVLLSYVIEPA